MKKDQQQSFFATVVLMAIMLFAQPAAAADRELLLATTTSTDNTGLLDYLAPKFTHATGIELKWIATGTGKALKLGENCDADVLLVHAPATEEKFVQAGYGINRREVMYNDFVVIGPPADPVGIKGNDSLKALAAIRSHGVFFISRGDNSGTNKKELALWSRAGGKKPDREPWYVQTGQGMLATIMVAAERLGYTLTDRGTYIKYEANNNGAPPLVVLVEKDPLLKNQYSILEVNPARCPQVTYEDAALFSSWLAGRRGQAAIGEFQLMGKQLFIPNAESNPVAPTPQRP